MSDDDRLTRIETELVQQRTLFVEMRGVLERLAMQFTALRSSQSLMDHRLMAQDERLGTIQQTLDAIKDLLDRPNGH